MSMQVFAIGLLFLLVVGVVGTSYLINFTSTDVRSQAAGRDGLTLGSRGDRGTNPRDGRGTRATPTPRASGNPSVPPVGTPPSSPPPTTPPPSTYPSVPPTGGGGTVIQPYAGAPECDESAHNPTQWHGIWNYQLGCHYDHEHKMNPRDLDDVFGTQMYAWAGGQTISYPWQTYAGAGMNFESYVPGTCTENTCKHEGYKWLYFRDRTSPEQISGALLLGTHAITDARVQYHAVGGEIGALTRTHSVAVEVKSCYKGIVSDETCGIYKGAGWLDLGRLNHPARGIYQPLPGDPPEFANTPAELEPYRIHPTGQNSLDSWQSEGNKYNYLPTDPSGLFRLSVGYGIHFDQGESTGETNPLNASERTAETHYWCLDKATGKFTCSNNNSVAALFRTWVSIPQSLDGSVYDEDKTRNGYFTFHGYTNRYGDIVDNCANIGLDCVPAVAENFPIGGCQNQTGICKSAYRGTLEQDSFEADISPEGEWWIEYPN
ncbi:MAG: hypothetical protein WAU07_02090 [Microgenomates group bacterium]